jgi:hypothetical protein
MSGATKNVEQFILVEDGDGNWFVIPEEREMEWADLVTDAVVFPLWAKSVGRNPGAVRFPVFEVQ